MHIAGTSIGRAFRRDREEGSAYIIALMALFLLTILGISVSLVTQTEIMASSQERIIERTFYAAEAGLEVSIARALGQGDYGPITHIAERAEVEQGNIMQLRERVDSSTFFCMGDAPCNLCSINQGSQWVRRNHMLSVNAERQAVDGGLCRKVAPIMATHAIRDDQQDMAGHFPYQAAILVAGPVTQAAG